ncbi:hypothetical protein WA556_004150 [Blastocystis sp. ATCC 50177/Nand II]
MSTDYPKLFRFCDLGSSLSDVLKEMVEEKKLSSAQMESILKCYDKEICGELERRQNELPKAHISADVDYYKRFFNTWSFFLTNCILDMNSKECVAEAHAKFFSTLATKE